ncbi:lipopolysaccharide assembly protein LapA domain-containing protein [Halomicronema sp. CCY15110]|uniref:lipopolysaccharide assembly protein LapA domain-containing protein n=1 Tax=Halomicronema sp. CCY15110 TaxID=2767773 RepID=UPI00194E39F2|nr:lipopolysaccharide assembly protein LapA domain-containing protein [Halomicronema sp. CCY15110]
MRLYVVSALVIAFLAILFALQNTNLVTIQLFVWEYQQSLALVLLGTLAIGVILGLLVSVPTVIRRNVRISRQQTQVESLLQQVDEKTQAVQSEAQKTTVLHQEYEAKLNQLGLLEPTTALLRRDLLPTAIAAQLQQLRSRAPEGPTTTFGVLTFKVLPGLPGQDTATEVMAAVAKILAQRSTPTTRWYSNGQGSFAATVPGLTPKAMTQYAEDLQATVLAQLPSLVEAQNGDANVAVGGAIADVSQATDGQPLIETAEQAVETALQRGRNRVKISQLA